MLENSMKTDQYSNIDLLIVDDEHDFRHQAVSYFKRIGFKVDQAEDGGRSPEYLHQSQV